MNMPVSLVGESCGNSNINTERAQLKTNNFLASTFPNPAMPQESRELAVRSVRESQPATINFSDGRIYVGEVEDGLPHGIGKMTYPDKSYQVGAFDYGKFWNGMWYRISVAKDVDDENGSSSSICNLQ
jgi:hypothetical protein